MSASIEFRNIDPELYRHPGEQGALTKLQKIPGFKKLLDMLSEGSGTMSERHAEIASMIRVSPGVYPALNSLWDDTLSLFGLGDIPLHIRFNQPEPCILTGGNDNPVVLLASAMLSDLPEREMAALLAKQAGAVRLGNANNLAISDFLRRVSDYSGIAAAPAAMIAWGVENWRRYAAFSSDRAAALSIGDPDAVVSLLDRCSGGGSKAWGGILEPDRLRIQGLEALSFERDWSGGRWRKFAMAMNRHNHLGLIRRLDLLDWFAIGDPGRILKGEIVRPEPKTRDTATETEKAAFEASDQDSQGAMSDPGLAYWGEFASADVDPKIGDGCNKMGCPMAEVMGWAGKGVNSVWKAGEAFVKTLQDQMQDKKNP